VGSVAEGGVSACALSAWPARCSSASPACPLSATRRVVSSLPSTLFNRVPPPQRRPYATPFANAQIEGVTTPCFATGLPLKNNGCR
jgi:hypothetical protein